MIKYLKTETYGDLPVRISYYAMKKYQEETGKSLMTQFQNGFSDMMSGELEYLLFYSLRRGFQVDKKEFKFEMKDMEDILDESFFEFIKLIPEFFPQAEETSKTQQKKLQSKSQSQKK
ncbi:MAG: hypothetical protein ACLFT4_06930 [Bacteroidales bacterium]